MSKTTPHLLIKIDNERPLDVLDLTASLSAVAEEYRRYSQQEARLYVERVSEGSIVAELISIAKGTIKLGSPMIPIALDTLAPFTGHWGGLLNSLAAYGRDSAKDAETRRSDKASLRNAQQFVQPALNGNNITVYGNLHIGQVNYAIDADKAGAISRTARHLLSHPLPDESRFENEPLQLYQVRDAKAGDMGYIDRFDKRPRKLTFSNEEAKSSVIHAATPFDVFFFVTGWVKTAGGDVASYLIERIDSIVPKEGF